MNKILVLDYNLELLTKLKKERIIVRTNGFDNIEREYGDSCRENDVVAMFIEQPFLSVSQIDFDLGWENIPIILKAYNLGDYHSFFGMVNNLRHLNIRIYLSSKSDKIYTDLKIMASSGVDCGLWIESTLDDEKFMDLASYNYISPIRHASIEPFANILKNIYSENHDNFDSVYFCDKTKFVEIDKDVSLLFLDKSEEKEFEDDVQCRMESHYKHFLDLDKCSKCQAFKICNHKMEEFLSNCEDTMEEVYKYAEMRHDMDTNQIQKSVCQL